MTTEQRFIERAEAARDLKVQLGNLAAEENNEIQFTEWSPGRKLVTIWNTETGEEATLPRYQAVAALQNPNATHTGYMWTSHKEQAPEPKINTVKCFLHPNSGERKFLNDIGVSSICYSEHFASETSKWSHARSKHSAEYKAYEQELSRIERNEQKEMQFKQTEAMMALAGKAAEQLAEEG